MHQFMSLFKFLREKRKITSTIINFFLTKYDHLNNFIMNKVFNLSFLLLLQFFPTMEENIIATMTSAYLDGQRMGFHGCETSFFKTLMD